MTKNARLEFEAALQDRTASPPTPAVMALKAFVEAARRLNSEWEKDDSGLLDIGYPRHWQAFDAVAYEAHQWYQKVRHG